MYPPERRRSSPQPDPPIRPRSCVARLINPSTPFWRACCQDMKTPLQAGQALGRSVFGRTEGLNYSAALRNGAVPARKCSYKADSSALLAVMLRCFTGPYPRIFSGKEAKATAEL